MEKPMYYDGSGKLNVSPCDSKQIVVKPEKIDKPTPVLDYPYPVHC